ncbi:hypothetical protein PFISCL1PPCAC_24930, partial [Pristionchus fissidentatus]
FRSRPFSIQSQLEELLLSLLTVLVSPSLLPPLPPFLSSFHLHKPIWFRLVAALYATQPALPMCLQYRFASFWRTWTAQLHSGSEFFFVEIFVVSSLRLEITHKIVRSSVDLLLRCGFPRHFVKNSSSRFSRFHKGSITGVRKGSGRTLSRVVELSHTRVKLSGASSRIIFCFLSSLFLSSLLLPPS